ncbi:DEAD/DEAH box helicase [Flaviflexus equikiangi]|uniref:DEAD/DEAH box helicase n=1 Tax=Flaviflexus equikiangi TaxID=2758573 RepID=UPI0021750DDF|nr:DEAD/DEAH box helicase [Flaviflexus equikiangi]
MARATDGIRIKVRGLSEYVRDHEATFYSALDRIEVLDPTKVEVVADTSPKYRRARLWLETALRQTPIPLYQEDLSVARSMLLDPLDYQLKAVTKALSTKNPRPRVLLADAVGLGKTLEIGMILTELIRRGRGERILVVTPKHILEQFQQELWSRFAIPLVRLDSLGIQKVRRTLPASRNPFTYYPRVIISMDTLKSPKYQAQLEKVNWDVVVIDEIHNATTAGTQNNRLARTLAPRTEAMVLASATPHNGNVDSFKEILRLLDPTSVLPDGSIDHEVANRLIIRRHRHSAEVSPFVGDKWAVRDEPQNILVPASNIENNIAQELHDTWIRPAKGHSGRDALFPWVLVKAFLSSPAALAETLKNRLKNVTGSGYEEESNLKHLITMNDELTPATSAKYQELLSTLKKIGVSKSSPTRVVIFSERVATLHWLQENLARDLKMKAGAVDIMHGGLTDQQQMHIVDEFKKEDSPLRILVTGDVASEGVNLHSMCHHLIHYDIPWSLIRIQQRNGRIDRYGQKHSPKIFSLILDPEESGSVGEVHVLTRLIERETEAHKLIGDAGALMGKHSVSAEEDEIRDVLRGSKDFDEVVADPTKLDDDLGGLDDIDLLLQQLAEIPDEPNHLEPMTQPPTVSLYFSEANYLADALREGFNDVPEKPEKAGGVSFERHANDIIELVPRPDLRRRLDFLPQDYVADRRVKEKLTLATSVGQARDLLDAARKGIGGSTWPTAHYLGPLHVVTQWAADHALAHMSRGSIPAVSANVAAPTVLLMATLTNKRGQVVSRAFVASSGYFDTQVVSDPIAWLTSVGLGEDAVNTGSTRVPDNIGKLMTEAVGATEGQIQPMMIAAENQAQEKVSSWSERARAWRGLFDQIEHAGGRARTTSKLIDQEEGIVASLAPDQRLIRPLVVVVPEQENSRG